MGKKKKAQLYRKSKVANITDRYNTVSRSRQDHATYAAMMENLDTNVGRVMDIVASVRQLSTSSGSIVMSP